MIYHIGFIEYDPNFIIVAAQRFDGSSKFIRNIEFMRVEQQYYSVDSFGKPFQDSSKVVTSVNLMLKRKSFGSEVHVYLTSRYLVARDVYF